MSDMPYISRDEAVETNSAYLAGRVGRQPANSPREQARMIVELVEAVSAERLLAAEIAIARRSGIPTGDGCGVAPAVANTGQTNHDEGNDDEHLVDAPGEAGQVPAARPDPDQLVRGAAASRDVADAPDDHAALVARLLAAEGERDCTCGIRPDVPAGPNHAAGCPMEVTEVTIAILRGMLADAQAERDRYAERLTGCVSERDETYQAKVESEEHALALEAQLATLRGVVERIGRFASSFTDESNDWLRVVQACERALAVPTVSADHCGYEKPHDPHGWDGDGFPDSETRCPGTPDALSDQEAGA